MSDRRLFSSICQILLAVVCVLSGAIDTANIHAQEMDNIHVSGKLARISFWRESHGLPTWHIRDIVMGPCGRIFMATEKGLISFDGKTFQLHPVPITGASPKDLQRLMVDGTGRIWLFYSSDSLAYIRIYDPLQTKALPATLEGVTARPFTHHVLANICKVEDNIWLLDPHTGRGGYIDASGRWSETLHDTTKREDFITYYPASDGKYWAVNMKLREVNLINNTGGILEQYAFKNIQVSNFWVSSDGGLYLIHASPEGSAAVSQIKEGVGLIPQTMEERSRINWGNGSLLGYDAMPARANNSEGAEVEITVTGVNLYDSGKLFYKGLDRYLRDKFRLDLSHNVFVTDDGAFWMIGKNALVRLELLSNPFTTFLTDIAEPPSTRGLVAIGDTLYINSYQGHFALSLGTKKWRPMTTMNRYPTGLGLTWFNGELWSGHHGNVVSVYSPLNGKTRFHLLTGTDWNYHTYNFFFKNANEIYFGAAYGLFKFRPNTQDFAKVEFRYPVVNCFHENAQGIWIGTSQGLFLMDSDKDSMEYHARHIFPLIIAANVRHIYEDRDGIFWLSTDKGLWRWQPFSTAVEIFDEVAPGLPSNFIHAVYEDSYGRLWISSDGGIICLDKNSHKFHSFTRSDGLSSSEMNYLSHCRDQQGRLYFGSISGITCFHPDSIKGNNFKPLRPFLMALELRAAETGDVTNHTRQAIEFDKPIVVPYHTDHISLKFFTAAYAGEKISYRYRIAKFDPHWFELSGPVVELFHPPYGEYVVEVEAYIHGSNLTRAATVRVPLHVERPYYLKADFLVFIAITTSLLVLFLFRWRQKDLRLLSERLTDEVLEKTSQLQQERDIIALQAEELKRMDEEKSTFFQDISHEIRNPLTLILGPVSELLKKEDLPAGYREKLERMKRNTYKILQLIEEVLELTRLEAGVITANNTMREAEPFLERIFEEFKEIAAHKRISFHLAHQLPDKLKCQTDWAKLEKIISNLIDNALKYTPAGGTVLVNAHYYDTGFLLLEIRDTGIGIDPAHINRIFDRYYQIPQKDRPSPKRGFGIGLAMCRSYAELLGGEIKVESTLGMGTTMRLKLPCQHPGGSKQE